MSENHKIEWESLRSGERAEIGLVQVDIVGHSRIEASERTLKKVKDIFFDEIERIAIAHDGKLFKWEGDGGSFMFLTRDGEGFNRLVKAALAMLNSMSATNKKIADETDLKTPIHVRLSCDSGMVEFDQNPTRISADFINSFIKNERKIGLADNICITDRVYKQLDSQLRTRFSLYKRSPEIRADIYCLPRRKFPLRWQHVVIAGLVGLALGFVCAVVLERYGLFPNTHSTNQPLIDTKDAKDTNVVFIGSGTVYLYLRALDKNIFRNLGDSEHLNVQALPAPTGIGAQIFAYDFDPLTTRLPDHPDLTLLVMAAKKLEIDELSRPVPDAENKPKTSPEAVFEFYLGADSIEALLVTEDKDPPQGKPTLQEDFGDIMSKSSGENLDQLKVADLASILKSPKYKDRVYMGMDKSGTRCVWETLLKVNYGDSMLPEFKRWDIQNKGSINDLAHVSNIYLGSKVWITEEEIRGINNPHISLTMVDGSNKPVKNGLYLYGFLGEKNKDGNYDLPGHVTAILNYLYKSLKKSGLIGQKCLDEQKDYFHLDSGGWVKGKSAGTSVYRADNCTERPPEQKYTCDEKPKK
jgi:hypothetical protein